MNADVASIITYLTLGFGSTKLHAHNLLTVQYIQKICGAADAVAAPAVR
jgi:hypothetical protein